MSDNFIPCTLMRLPEQHWLLAARTAVEINPVNESPVGRLLRAVPDFVIEPAHIALLTSKYWGAGGVKLGVYFMDTQDVALKQRILSHMNAWNQYANVTFAEAGAGNAQVRLARQSGGGYWSYLGTDILHIPRNQATMNLDSFSLSTPESEYRRVVRHETGHALGFPHEHMRREIVQRLDPRRTTSYFQQTQGWSAQEVQQQVLTALEEAQLTATPNADVVSIMCYQLPAQITTDGQPIPGGLDIDPTDGNFAARIYPKPQAPPPPAGRVTLTVSADLKAGTYTLTGV